MDPVLPEQDRVAARMLRMELIALLRRYRAKVYYTPASSWIVVNGIELSLDQITAEVNGE